MPREGKARVLDDAEFRRLLKIAAAGRHGKRDVALICVSFGLGLRAKELASLAIRDVLADNGKLREEVNLVRRMTKGAKQRHVYLTSPKVRAALDDYLTERRARDGIIFNLEAPLFRSQRGGRFSANTLQMLFRRIYDEAGLDGASSHSGRRTSATRLIEKGVDIKAVATLMGHASIAMTAQYVQDNPTRLKNISSEVL